MLKAPAVIAKLQTSIYAEPKAKEPNDGSLASTLNDSYCKCLICQCPYEEGEILTHLPCNHVFHKECVEEWLTKKDVCPYCRVCIQEEEE